VRREYVCFTSVHGLVEAQRGPCRRLDARCRRSERAKAACEVRCRLLWRLRYTIRQVNYGREPELMGEVRSSAAPTYVKLASRQILCL